MTQTRMTGRARRTRATAAGIGISAALLYYGAQTTPPAYADTASTSSSSDDGAGSPASDGQSDPGTESGGSSAGEPAGGEPTGGESSGGDSSGGTAPDSGTASGGDPGGDDPAGSDPSGDDPSGSDPSGDDRSSGGDAPDEGAPATDSPGTDTSADTGPGPAGDASGADTTASEPASATPDESSVPETIDGTADTAPADDVPQQEPAQEDQPSGTPVSGGQAGHTASADSESAEPGVSASDDDAPAEQGAGDDPEFAPATAPTDDAAMVVAAQLYLAPADTPPVIGDGPAPITRDGNGAPVRNLPSTIMAGIFTLLGYSPDAGIIPAPGSPQESLVVLWGVWEAINRRFANSYPHLSPTGQNTDTSGVVTGSLGATDPDRDTLTYTVTQGPAYGTVVINPDGTYVYTPDPALAHELSEAGSDSFTVSASDETAINGWHIHLFSATTQSGSSTTITVPVAPQNQAPTAAVVTTSPTISTVAVGDGPTRVLVSADGSEVYVFNEGTMVGYETVGAGISVVDPHTGTVVSTIPLYSQTSRKSSIVMSADGRYIYVLNPGSFVQVIDTESATYLGETHLTDWQAGGFDGPTNVSLSADGTILYTVRADQQLLGFLVSDIMAGIDTGIRVPPFRSSRIYLSDTPGALVTGSASTPWDNNGVVAIAPWGSENTCPAGLSTCSVISGLFETPDENGEYHGPWFVIKVGGQATAIAVDANGIAYVTDGQDDQIHIVNARTGNYLGTRLSGYHPAAITVNPDSTRVFLVNSDSDTVHYFEVADPSWLELGYLDGSNFPVGAGPDGIVVGSDGTVYVTHSSTDTLTIVRPKTSGTITGSDSDGDSLTYTVTGAAEHGLVTLDPATGEWEYVRNSDWLGLPDTFIVTVDDGHGGTTTVTVTV